MISVHEVHDEPKLFSTSKLEMKNEIVVSGQVRSFLAQGLSKSLEKRLQIFLCIVVDAIDVAAVDDAVVDVAAVAAAAAVDDAAIDVAAVDDAVVDVAAVDVDVAHFVKRPRTSHKKLLRY